MKMWKILIPFFAFPVAASVTLEHISNSYYAGIYEYMSPVFSRVTFPVAWFENRIVSKDSQANMAALYAMSEVATSRPFVTNAPSAKAYSFSAQGMYEPLKRNDIGAIASRVKDLSTTPIDFIYRAGSFVYTPWCFNPLGTSVFQYVTPAGSYAKITESSMRTYTGANIGLGGLDFNWQKIFDFVPPNYTRAVASRFVSLCTVPYMGVTNIIYDTSAAPTDIINMYRWSQSHTTDIAPWESTMTMQRAWLWNVAPIVAAFNTVFWYNASSIYDTSWEQRERSITASLDIAKIDAAIYNYMQENSNPDEWGVLTVSDCVFSDSVDTGEIRTTSTNMTWVMDSSFSAEGGTGVSFEGRGANKEIGTVTPYTLTNSASEWAFTGIQEKVPSTATNSATYKARVYHLSLGSPSDFNGVEWDTEDKGWSGTYYYYYKIPYNVILSVQETPFGTIKDSYWADSLIQEKTCYTVLFLAHRESAPPTLNVYAGAYSATGSFFYNTLRSFDAPNRIATEGMKMRYEMPSEEPTWATSVTVDLSQWENSGEIDTLAAYYFPDVDGEEVLDIYRIDQTGNIITWENNSNLELSVGGRRVTATWATNFQELRQLKSIKSHTFSANMFGAIVLPGFLQIK